MDLTYSYTTLQSLQTEVTNSPIGLSDELLANSTLLNNTSTGLGLYSDPIEYGDPTTDINYWRQQDGDYSCAVVAQISVYESLTGQSISEVNAVNFASEQGWFDPNAGTPIENTVSILDYLEIDTVQGSGSLDTLETALSMGNKPIVALDANEIWTPQRDQYGNSVEQEYKGHAVWVTGIDYESNGSVSIILNDSGIPDGSSSYVDYYDFMNAWDDTGYFVAIADNPVV